MTQLTKPRIITILIAFLILVFLIVGKYDNGISGWDMLTARPVPSSFMQGPTPAPPGHPIPSNFPSGIVPVSPTPALDTRTWSQRLRSPASEIPGIKWKTYHNEEYGFEMQYPDDWTYEIKNSTYKEATIRYLVFSINLSTRSIKSDLYTFKLSFAIQKKDIKDYEKNLGQEGKSSPKENIYINGVDWMLTNPDLENVLLGLYTSRQGRIYNFSEGFLRNDDFETVIHIIKSFKFIN